MSAKYARFKRYEVKCLVEEQYGIRILSMHETDRGIMFYTDHGIKRLKQIDKDYGKALFAVSAYNHVKNNGFGRVSSILTTLSGGFMIKYDKNIYVLQDFTKGKIFRMRTKEEAQRIGEILAQFHKASENFIPASGCSARVDWGRWMDKFKSYSRNIKNYKESVLSKANTSQFDDVYIKHADEFYYKTNQAYKLLAEHGYLEKVHQSMQRNQLTHKEFKKHAVLLSEDNEIFITEMENCGYDICEIDLAMLLERFIGNDRAGGISNIDLAKAALDGYAKVLPLDSNSIKIIQAFILEPKKFYKIADRYYGKKKNDTELELLNKLEKCIQKEAQKDEMIIFLESYGCDKNEEKELEENNEA